MKLCKYEVRDEQGRGTQGPLSCTALSSVDIAFAVFLVSNVATKLLLVITLLRTYKKIRYRLFCDAPVLCSKSKSISDFPKRLTMWQQRSHFARLQQITSAWNVGLETFAWVTIWEWALSSTVEDLQEDSLIYTPTKIGAIFLSPHCKM